MRIVSLLPAATEMACAIGLRDQLVGVTHECDYPLGIERLPHVTGTRIPADASSGEIDQLIREQMKTEPALYSLDEATFADLKPDLILTQTLCNVCAVGESQVQRAVAALPHPPRIINLQPHRLDDVLEGLRTIGLATDRDGCADKVVGALRMRIDAVRQRAREIARRPRTLLLEWIDPLFSAGHWNPELIELAGGDAILGTAGKRSQTLDWQSVRDANPEFLFIACCGFDVARASEDLRLLETQLGWDDLACVQRQRVFFADGSQYFNRPGPRLVDSLEMLAGAIAGEDVAELTAAL